MGAIFFYIFIYFIGYYGSAVFNLLTVRPLVTNRFMAALVPVVAVAIAHAYMIVTKPPPASQDITVESALFTYVIMPVIIVSLGAVYFMWNSRKPEEEETDDSDREADEELDSNTENTESEGAAASETADIPDNEQLDDNKTDKTS
ncbi:hypothetical protein SAMN05421690_105116 [Nitrosomonas sp. Nm51]|uniref:hypothetical protein n=1 Tax=Nitrosomonas sp. Nm51 TaxID=133720 RepID=UPI0008CB3D3B|nr:hypothetical protein [Nitrosomonas sp. Nm51]SER67218.1 hypothetical protein SAMN05421690_105116 [Nitrosomonas sp. Nm51]